MPTGSLNLPDAISLLVNAGRERNGRVAAADGQRQHLNESSDGLAGAEADVDVAELRRQMEALKAENERLRQQADGVVPYQTGSHDVPAASEHASETPTNDDGGDAAGAATDASHATDDAAAEGDPATALADVPVDGADERGPGAPVATETPPSTAQGHSDS